MVQENSRHRWSQHGQTLEWIERFWNCPKQKARLMPAHTWTCRNLCKNVHKPSTIQSKRSHYAGCVRRIFGAPERLHLRRDRSILCHDDATHCWPRWVRRMSHCKGTEVQCLCSLHTVYICAWTALCCTEGGLNSPEHLGLGFWFWASLILREVACTIINCDCMLYSV